MKTLLAIGIGGFIGSVARYLLSQFIQSKFLSVFPFGTLGINIIGCFVIGVVFALYERGNMSTEWRLFLATGICGGFTTFSAFSNETLALLRDGQTMQGLVYIGASVVLGLFATFLGITIIKMI